MKIVMYLMLGAALGCVNYFVLRLAGMFLGYSFTVAECTGIFVLLLWLRVMIGGGRS